MLISLAILSCERIYKVQMLFTLQRQSGENRDNTPQYERCSSRLYCFKQTIRLNKYIQASIICRCLDCLKFSLSLFRTLLPLSIDPVELNKQFHSNHIPCFIQFELKHQRDKMYPRVLTTTITSNLGTSRGLPALKVLRTSHFSTRLLPHKH